MPQSEMLVARAMARGRGSDVARIARVVLCVALFACAGVAHGFKFTSAFKEKGDVPPSVCFVAATIPWGFGAYQTQTSGVARAFADRGHRTFWLPRVPNVRLPEGTYTLEEALRAFKPGVRRPNPNEREESKHLTFLGVPNVEKVMSPGINALGLTMQELNRLATLNRIDAFVLLMDVGNMYLDANEFKVPTVMWMPYHHEVPDSSSPILSMYSAVAALSDTTGRAIELVQPLTRTIPHFIDRAALNARADAFDANAKREKGVSDDADEATIRTAIRRRLFDSVALDKSYKRNLDEIDNDTFLVLMQGGNYEDQDRKGWVASIHAFAQFQRENPDLKTHLWIHAVDSAMTQNDMNDGSKPPVAVVRTGVALRLVLQHAGIPDNMYTLDENRHDVSRTTALKRHADVCLHTSKAEGFGMVVLECQALGTPVITTNFTAMRDYTKYGIAVEPAAFESIQGSYWAAPSVPGAARALTAISTGAVELPPLESVFAWIDDVFALDTITEQFRQLLTEAKVAHSRRKPWALEDTFAERPFFTVTTDEYPRLVDWSTPWTMYHHPDVEVNYQFIQYMMIQHTKDQYYGVVVAPTSANGRLLPMDVGDGVHNINPHYVVLMPTWIMKQLQTQASYVWGTAFRAIGSVSSQKYMLMLPEGYAKMKADAQATKARNDEL